MKKVNLILLIAIIVVILLIAGWGIWKMVGSSKFSAVYLTTGDLYFGKLVHFPKYGMSQVYTIQVNMEDQDNPYSVQRFKNVFWGPGDFLNINKDQVLWSTELDSTGQMAQLLEENPDLLPQQQQVPQQQQQVQPQQQEEASIE
jgi:hypothetical protein